MFPALIAGGASLLGGYLANRGQKKEAQTNRGFQERMASTQWQRAKTDMEAAGINPALAYSKGGNAAPAGSMAQIKDSLGPGVSSAMQARRMEADLKLIQAQTAKATGEALSTAAAGRAADSRQEWMERITGGRGGEPYSIAQVRMWGDEVEQSRANVGGIQARTRKDKLSGDVLQPMAKLAETMGVALPVLMMMMGSGGAGGVVKGAGAMARRIKTSRLTRRIDRARKKR